mmetsp:Transcript_40408/g.92897  ORF Transcript_40408/g.92897 Transcript_40408/m.92897 type:complete len:234 (-) Transcript_40408:450-1151(-)
MSVILTLTSSPSCGSASSDVPATGAAGFAAGSGETDCFPATAAEGPAATSLSSLSSFLKELGGKLKALGTLGWVATFLIGTALTVAPPSSNVSKRFGLLSVNFFGASGPVGAEAAAFASTASSAFRFFCSATILLASRSAASSFAASIRANSSGVKASACHDALAFASSLAMDSRRGALKELRFKSGRQCHEPITLPSSMYGSSRASRPSSASLSMNPYCCANASLSPRTVPP